MKIPDFKTYLKESHWSEMNRRSQGIVKRKEDDINLLNREDFTNYLNTIYEFHVEPELKVRCGSQFITVPLFVYNFIRRSIILDPQNGRAGILGVVFDKWPDDLKKYLNTQYSTEYGTGDSGDSVFFIRPKEGEGDNKFFIKLIDDIIANVDSPLLRKKVNESHWSEMNRRSQGITIRKEDKIITNIDEIKPVDLGSNVPIYFADRDLEVNGEVKFTWEEVKGFIQKIEETGWELPAGPKGMQSIFYNGNQPPRFRDDAYEKKWVPFVGGTLTSNENDAKLFFPSDNYYLEVYWCVDDNYKKGDLDTYSLKFGTSKRITQRSFIVGDPNDFNGCLIRTNNEMVERKCRIRLIRYK